MKDPTSRPACVSARSLSNRRLGTSRSLSRSSRAFGGALRLSAQLPATIVLALVLLAPSAHGSRKVPSYPKILAFTGGIADLPESAQDSLSWSDVLVCNGRPEAIASMRARNANMRFLWNISPQLTPPPSGDNPWWIADTLWSPARLGQYYVQKNDWYMRTTSGELLTNGTAYLLNWTRFCPLGTYGSAKGLRASEWFASVLLPQIARSGQYWEPWSWDSQHSYNGFLFEIMADCLGSYGWQYYADADPDRDGDRGWRLPHMQRGRRGRSPQRLDARGERCLLRETLGGLSFRLRLHHQREQQVHRTLVENSHVGDEARELDGGHEPGLDGLVGLVLRSDAALGAGGQLGTRLRMDRVALRQGCSR